MFSSARTLTAVLASAALFTTGMAAASSASAIVPAAKNLSTITVKDAKGDVVGSNGKKVKGYADITKVTVTYGKKNLTITTTFANLTKGNWKNFSAGANAVSGKTCSTTGIAINMNKAKASSKPTVQAYVNGDYSRSALKLTPKIKNGKNGTITFDIPLSKIGKKKAYAVSINVATLTPTTVKGSDFSADKGKLPVVYKPGTKSGATSVPVECTSGNRGA